MCHLGQDTKKIISKLFLNMERKCFSIFDKDMTQIIYENYLGILGVMEILAASQPRANWVIPLTEKGIFPRKRLLRLVQDGNGKVLGRV